MKKIIKHKLYDTSTANLIVANRHYTNNSATDCEALLYRTRKGAWFLFKEGGALTGYAVRDGHNWVGSSRIEPITEKEARNFCKKYGDPSDYAEYFPDLMQV